MVLWVEGHDVVLWVEGHDVVLWVIVGRES